ncbi:reverse transcriptase domain-containing protein, partial [Tanacetum coccineum]
MVRKADGTWRMCIDFTSQNKACPKDSYPLPAMDQKIESLEGFKLKCFLDAYKGYHQIRMARLDEEKTSFHTEHETFCYEKMPFGLKNAGATYQRLMNHMFASQLGRNIEIYVDDMVIKSKNKDNLIADIAETFDTLRKANMKLNQKKCTFRVEAGQFLGYIITNEGIQANPEKVQAISNMASPKTLREIQSLNGKLATLGRFLEKSAERQVLLKPKNSGRIAKWAIELGEHEILYKPRSVVKGQILADFLAESPTITDPQEKSIADKPGKNTSPVWILFTDGAASLEGSGAGLILTDLNGQE